MQLRKVLIAPSHLLNRTINVHTPFLYLLILFLPLCASAQTLKEVTLTEGTQIKVKLTRKLISGRVRIGDYIPFTVVENVLVSDGSAGLVLAIPKDTPVLGRVVERKHRFAFFRSGKFAVALDKVRAADGTDIPVYIRRPQQIVNCKDKITTKSYNPGNVGGTIPCVKGRTYSGTLTNALPSAIGAAITTGALVLLKDSSAKAAAAITLAGQVATQPGLSTILNGIDAEMDDGEIFDAVIKRPTPVKGKPFTP